MLCDYSILHTNEARLEEPWIFKWVVVLFSLWIAVVEESFCGHKSLELKFSSFFFGMSKKPVHNNEGEIISRYVI